MKIAVIGGANTDICGAPSGKLLLKDSNPGRLSVKPGGVGRNIAHDLILLGSEILFVTALGTDMFSKNILESCTLLGMDMSKCLVVEGGRGCTYLYITDETGDMHIAVSDMGILENITPEYIESVMPAVNGCDAIVIDANISAAAAKRVCELAQVPVFADPVSMAKSVKLQGVLDKLAMLKPNRYEAEALTGESDPERAALALVERGVKAAYVSCGEKGMIAADKNGAVCTEAEKLNIVNANGAGDASMAAIVYATMLGKDLETCARCGDRAGAITAMSEETNSPFLSREAIGL